MIVIIIIYNIIMNMKRKIKNYITKLQLLIFSNKKGKLRKFNKKKSINNPIFLSKVK